MSGRAAAADRRIGGPRMGAGAVLLVALVVLCGGGAVSAQRAELATAPVEVDHWAYAALDRLAAAGLLEEEWAPGRRPQPAGVMMEALREASRRAKKRSSPLDAFAAASVDRFGGEFPQLGADGGAGRSSAAARRSVMAGAVAGGPGLPERSWVLGYDLSASVDRHLAIRYGSAVSFGPDADASPGPSSIAVVGRLGGWWVSAGRQRVGFGPGTGGLVLNDAASFDGVLAGTGEPLRLGGPGRWLGPVHVRALASRIPADTVGAAAWFGAMRVTLEPHPRIRVGLNRTLVVARRVGDHSPTFADLLRIAVGKHTQPNFEDQRASIDATVLLGTGEWRMASYLEWGIEDTAGAHFEDPALTVGAFVPHLPGLSRLSARYEYTAFGEAARVCGFCDAQRRNWYRHSGVRPAYVAGGGRLIGHPLGGYGHEHRVEAAAWLGGARARIEALYAARAREPGNLLYAERPGRSRAAALRTVYRLGRSLTLDGGVWRETGEAGWTDASARVAARVLF
ncbi:MAG: capsule assembly Wzi family protein [Gemmatimonadota bacterium]